MYRFSNSPIFAPGLSNVDLGFYYDGPTQQITQDGVTYCFYGQFQKPLDHSKEDGLSKWSKEYYEDQFVVSANEVLLFGEMMRRGFGIIPGDRMSGLVGDSLLGEEETIDHYLPFFRHKDVDAELLRVFHEAVRDRLPEAFHGRSPGSDVPAPILISRQEINQIFDNVLLMEDFNSLMKHYEKYMERIIDRARLSARVVSRLASIDDNTLE